MLAKSPNAYRTIAEVSVELGEPQHILRFWEKRFPQIKPMRIRAGGRRYYSAQQMMVLRDVQKLLRVDRYTIEGAKRVLDG